MNRFTRLPTLLRRFPCAGFALLVACGAEKPVHAELLHWEVTGRVTEVSDPDGIFGPISVDDPVQGCLCYDTSLEPQFFFDLAVYMGECSPDGPLVVVNPGEPNELEISTPASGGEPFLTVGNDFFDEELDQTIDCFSAEYLAEPPTGYQGSEPLVVFSFAGDDPVDSLDLPTDLNVQDWPMSEIIFTDYAADDVSPFGEIIAG